MISAIIYKEVLKSYKVIFLFSIIFVWVIIGTYLDASKAMSGMSATSSILNIIQMGRFDYNNIGNISIVFAIALGIAQFYPEVSSARIRLFLHLPMTHFKLITVLISIGLVFLCLLFFTIGFFYYYILNSYYPIEVFQAIYSKLLPIFLASILCYFTTMIAFLEPKLIRKVLYVAICYLVVDINSGQSGFFVSNVFNFTLVAIIGIYILTVYDVFTSYTKGYIK